MKLSARQKYCYGIGALGKDLVYALVATFFMFYLTDVKEMSAAFVGTLFFIARVWDAIIDPIMGLIVDNTKTRYGKFRPWILVGTLINAVVLVFLFANIKLEGTALYVYVSVVYILWGMTYTLMDIPYWSFIPAMTNDEKERNEIAVIPRVFASLGFFIASAFGLIFVNNVIGGDQAKGFSILAIVIACVFVVTTLITVFNVKEKSTVENKRHFKIKEIFTTIGRNDQLIAMFATIAIYTIAINLTSGFGLYYFKYDVGNENLFSQFTMFAGVAQVLAMIIFPKISSVFSRKNVFIAACALPILGYVMMFGIATLFNNNFALLVAAGVFSFLGFGFSQILATVMLADTVDYGEYKLGYRSESIIFSMQPFIVKLATALQALITGVGLSLIGYKSNQAQAQSTIWGLRFMMFVVPTILIGIALYIYLKYYKLNGEYKNEVMSKLAENKVNVK